MIQEHPLANKYHNDLPLNVFINAKYDTMLPSQLNGLFLPFTSFLLMHFCSLVPWNNGAMNSRMWVQIPFHPLYLLQMF